MFLTRDTSDVCSLLMRMKTVYHRAIEAALLSEPNQEAQSNAESAHLSSQMWNGEE